jgi:hypothetical protein
MKQLCFLVVLLLMSNYSLHGGDFSNGTFALKPAISNFSTNATYLVLDKIELLKFIIDKQCVPFYASSLGQRVNIFGEGMKLVLCIIGVTVFVYPTIGFLLSVGEAPGMRRTWQERAFAASVFVSLGTLVFGTLAALSLSGSPTCG